MSSSNDLLVIHGLNQYLEYHLLLILLLGWYNKTASAATSSCSLGATLTAASARAWASVQVPSRHMLLLQRPGKE